MLHLLPLTTKFFFFLEKATAPTAAMCPAATAKHDPVEAFQTLTCKLTPRFTSKGYSQKTVGGRGAIDFSLIITQEDNFIIILL